MSFSELFVPAATLADHRHVTNCCNLRPTPAGGLSATGEPDTVATIDDDDFQPVPGGIIPLPDGLICILVTQHDFLKGLLLDGTVITIAPTEGEVTCVQPIDDGFIVMTEGKAPRRFECYADDEEEGGLIFYETELFPDLPPLSIVREDLGTSTAELPTLTLGSSYTTNSQHLTDSDREKIDKAMREAYVNLTDGALLRGRYVQPVVARYRLIGEEGRVLYTSAPVVVTPNSGLQGVKTTLHLTGEGFRECHIAPLTATEFVPAIRHTRPADAAWDLLVRSVRLEVSPQLHPYSAILPGYNAKSASTASQLTMWATLPGLDPLRKYADVDTRMAIFVANILDNPDTTMHPMATAPDTLTELQQLRTIYNLVLPVATEEEDQLAVQLSTPHTFTAATSARSGDLIAWGDLTVNPYHGYPLPEMAISVPSATGSLPTAAHVSMHDGSSVVSTAVMPKSGQPQLSPLVTYPSPDAVSMTLLAGDKALTLPLKATPGGRMAYYLAPDLRPMQLTEEREGFAVPSASPRKRRYPSAVALCPVATPFTPTAVSYGDGTRLAALLPAMRHSNSFTVPSARFYLFGLGGISSMTLSDSRRRVNMSLLDSRPVTSASAVTPIAGGVAVLAGGALVTVTGSRPHTLLEHCGAGMLGWCGRYGELWCISPPPITEGGGSGGPEALIVTPDGSAIYTRTGLGLRRVLSTGAGMYLFTADGRVLNPAVERDAPVTVAYAASVPHRLRPGSAAMLFVPLFGRNLTGNITIGATHGAPERVAATLRSLAVNGGDLNHPLAEPLRLPHSHALTFAFTLTTPYPSLLRLCQP